MTDYSTKRNKIIKLLLNEMEKDEHKWISTKTLLKLGFHPHSLWCGFSEEEKNSREGMKITFLKWQGASEYQYWEHPKFNLHYYISVREAK